MSEDANNPNSNEFRIVMEASAGVVTAAEQVQALRLLVTEHPGEIDASLVTAVLDGDLSAMGVLA